MKTRQELYNEGYFFLRKRHLSPRCRLSHIAPEWAVYISKEFGRWKLVEKFDTEEQADLCVEEFQGLYDNVIVE
jgi:hypothetical protein